MTTPTLGKDRKALFAIREALIAGPIFGTPAAYGALCDRIAEALLDAGIEPSGTPSSDS